MLHYSYKTLFDRFDITPYILKQYEIALNLHLPFVQFLSYIYSCTVSMCSSVDRRRIVTIRLENVSGIER